MKRMTKHGIWTFVCGLSLVAASTHASAQDVPAPTSAPAPAQDAGQDALTDRISNDPRPETFRPYGLPRPPQVWPDKSVQFGKALRVSVPGPQPEDWRIGVTIPVLKPIAAGDKVVLAFWARAHRTEDGAPGKIARVRLEVATPPHRSIFAEPVEVGPEWKMYQVIGTADQDYAAQALNAAMHLAGAKQVIDIGPFFVLVYHSR